MHEVREMAYSTDLREKALKHRENHTYDETVSTFGVSVSAIIDWEKLMEETGSLEKRPLNRTFKKIDPVELAEFVLANPDAYLHEIGEYFGCSATAVFYALENQHITLKKLKFVIVRQMRKNAKLSKKIWQD
jgi:transposase